jgi:hypothetical protein
MAKFTRRLDCLDHLGKLCVGPGVHWWKDLLSLWRPSGIDAGDFGLRLAIRDNYLNFYRRGQSIACVEMSREGKAIAKTHIKYVDPTARRPLDAQYVCLRDGALWRDGQPWGPYQGCETVQKWIATVDREYAGEEKKFVDRMVAASPNVIDLEMAIPAWGEQRTAPRMDVVTIEASGNLGKVVFWEAKLCTDPRVRCRGDVVRDERPEVLRQLADYRRFLTAQDHPALVAKAYIETAMILVRLRAMADGLGAKHRLGGEIVAAASGAELLVDCEPRLVVFNQWNANQAAWAVHAQRLRDAGIRMTVMDEGGLSALLAAS